MLFYLKLSVCLIDSLVLRLLLIYINIRYKEQYDHQQILNFNNN